MRSTSPIAPHTGWRCSALHGLLVAALVALPACGIKDSGFFEPTQLDQSVFRSCSLTLATITGVPSSLNVGDAASGRFDATALSVFNGCDSRRATYTFTSASPSVATVAQTAGSTPTNVAGAFGVPLTIAAVGAGSTTLNVSITLDDGQTRTASVPMTVVRPQGNLTVTISGLPSGTAADVTVTQGTTTAGRLTATGTLNGLNTGVHTITASTVTSADGTIYEASPASQQVTITNGGTANASIAYAPQVGSLRVVIDGLPVGASAAVTLVRGNTTLNTITASTVLTGLPVGTYTLNPGNVTFAGVTYAPTSGTRTVTIAKGAEVAATISYAAITGLLNVRISGLPSGANADVRVALGATAVGTATVTTTFDRLTPGAYTISANNVTSGGVVYVPSPPTQSVTVSPGSTPAIASVVYAAQVLPTAMALTLTGLPAGSTPQVTITGPGFSRTVSGLGPVVIEVPAPGTYTVSVSRYLVSPIDGYDPDVPVRQVVVTAQQTTNVTVPFIRLGAIEIRVTGLPTNLAGPTGSATDGTNTYEFNGAGVTLVRPGVYDIRANAVVAAGSLFRALTPLQRVTIGSGGALLIIYAYYLAEVQYLISVQTGIFSDLLGHRFFVNMFAAAILRAVLTNPPPLAESPGRVALRADPSNLILTGPSPWITVTGTRDEDGTITLTGSGTAAGFANVPARLTGVLTSTGGITGGRLQYGQSTPPTGLPNGPIIYTITGTGAPAPVAGLDAYVRLVHPQRPSR